jgi:hypothetical protein
MPQKRFKMKDTHLTHIISNIDINLVLNKQLHSLQGTSLNGIMQWCGSVLQISRLVQEATQGKSQN